MPFGFGKKKPKPAQVAEKVTSPKANVGEIKSPKLKGKKGIKSVVSKKKKRFIEDGFDLDLSYITPQIIAMGFPSIGAEALYRNSMVDVKRFLETKHAGHYKVYNLCAEKEYDEKEFPEFARYGHLDHNPPPFDVLAGCCRDMKAYIARDEKNVAVLHCKAGKGRTGTVISSYLQLSGEADDADEAMNMFGKARTKNNKGVTIPSQQRYVQLYGSFVKNELKQGNAPPERQVVLKRVLLTHAPKFDRSGGCDPFFKILDGVNLEKLYDMRKDKDNKIKGWRKEATREFLVDVPLNGDLKIVFYDHNRVGAPDKMFSLWLHTGFLKRNHYVFSQDMLDGASKDTKNEHFHPSFNCELFFEGIPEKEETGLHQHDAIDTAFHPEKKSKYFLDDDQKDEISEEDEDDIEALSEDEDGTVQVENLDDGEEEYEEEKE
jgi:phosphatidylinositol-3,4,5-trisphosphate 3-phosphatase/dual-specificity protein phosphatase PTEN